MKNNIIDRYDKNQDGEIIIKIYTSKIEDLYENYDKKSTFIKKDLKDDLENYLIESVEEIGNHPFTIDFYFDEKSDFTSDERLKNSIKEYFEYLQFLEHKNMKEELKNSLIFLIIGFVFVSISFNLTEHENFFYKLISEGAMVGGWVSLWEALATILIKWLPLRKNIKIFKKITNAEVHCF
ncbi:MAG: hypothetical protein RBQ84_10400 [Arcobacter sp.]|jgi:hypothetical protein|uniref:hypothetical protein n=1 Tax=Arcobacter sp. TaxID=1872629 RepID=UPI002A74FE12|nr:hypothetical protein [Arcobacter sp.]MDY3201352.1 hypothetical protein [Arcobacter sp.]